MSEDKKTFETRPDCVWAEVEPGEAGIVARGYDVVLSLPEHPNISSPFCYRRILDENDQLVKLVALEPHLGVALDDVEELAPRDTMVILAQVAAGLGHLHHFGVIHKDIKASNVLVTADADGEICAKLSDFDVAIKLGVRTAVNEEQGNGTEPYLAPECLEQKPYSTPSDIWSFWVMAYGLICAAHADDTVEAEQRRQTRRLILPPSDDTPYVPASVPAKVRVFLTDMPRDPAKRPTAAQVQEIFETATV